MTEILFRAMHKEDEPQVKGLWQYAFRDPKPFTDWYFSAYMSPEEVFVAVENDKVLAALQSIRHTMLFNDLPLETRYIVGVSTLPEGRGKGLVQKLLKKAQEEVIASGLSFWMLMPFEASFYTPYGFHWIHSHKRIEMETKDILHTHPKDDGSWIENPPWQDVQKVYAGFLHNMQVVGLLRNARFWQGHYKDIALSDGHVYGHKNAQGVYDAAIFYRFDSDAL